jgi:hypothetical protein
MKVVKTLAIILPAVLVIIIFAVILPMVRQNRLSTETIDPSTAVVTEEIGPTISPNWEKYTNDELGLSFSYPPNYTLAENHGGPESYYIAIMSPADPNKPIKETSVGANEMKIEVVTEPSVENDSSEKCFSDHNVQGTVPRTEREVVVSGISAVQYDWEALGTGQFTCVIAGGTRFMINKYPLKTSLENDYFSFIQSLVLQ